MSVIVSTTSFQRTTILSGVRHQSIPHIPYAYGNTAAAIELQPNVQSYPVIASPEVSSNSEPKKAHLKMGEELGSDILKSLYDVIVGPENRSTADQNTEESDAEIEEDAADSKEADSKYSIEAAFDWHVEPLFEKENPKLNKDFLFNKENWTSRKQGFEIVKCIVLPIRDILRKVWVAFELLLVGIDLILNIIALANGNRAGYVIVHILLVLTALAVSSVDAWGVFWRQCAHICSGRCSVCLGSKRNFDFGRTVFTELILTPLLLTDIFDVVIGQGYRGNAEHADKFGFALFVIDVIFTISFLYFARLAILATAVLNANNFFKDIPNESSETGFLKSIGINWREICCMFGFVVHTAGQFMVHISMLVAIGFVLHLENQHLYDSQTEIGEEGYHASGYLIYMCITVCFLPFLGHFSYFVLANFWAQDFSFSLIVDFAKLIELSDSAIQNVADTKLKLKKMIKKMNIPKLNENYAKFTNPERYFCCSKIVYPYFNPFVLIFCLVFGLLHLLFYVFAWVAYTTNVEAAEASGIGEYGYAILASFVGDLLVNAYVLFLSSFWTSILIIAFLLIALLLLCACSFCCINIFCGCFLKKTDKE